MSDKIKAAVKELADSELRSLSQMAAILIQEGLERRRKKSDQKPSSWTIGIYGRFVGMQGTQAEFLALSLF